MISAVLLALAVAAGFLTGSLPFSYWVVRIFRGADIRTLGSRNAGATNVFRTQGWRIGSLALALDIAKGVAACALIPLLAAAPGWCDDFLYRILLGVSAILGHTFTPFLGWRGGKGVATSAGVFCALLPAPFFLAVSVFAAVFAATRMISVSSMAGAAVFPIGVILFEQREPHFVTALAASSLVALFIFYTHRSNIRRLLRGEEQNMYKSKK